MKLNCSKCDAVYEGDKSRWQCDCGGYLSYEFMPIFTKADIKTERHNMWRYDFAYPLKYEELSTTYNEGLTPLVKVGINTCNLYAKMESLMPTGSFKDRGTVMVVNYLKKNSVEKITEDSSGNAGASVAGYCALAKIPCEIYVPKATSKGKLIQMKAYGAKIYEIEGTREDVAEAAQKHKESYAGHNWHPLFIQGTKSIAYELWEQNNFKAPENIIASAGNGSVILGLYYGFKELLHNNQIDKLPRLFAVQAENCNPIYREYIGSESNEPFKATIAEGISLRVPNKGSKVVQAVRETGGEVLSVKEEKIIQAVKTIAKHGFYVEPTSAAAYAGLESLCEREIIKANDHVIWVISGNGLKANAEIGELLDK